ncbi:beta-eliminating lyase-related protein [Albimonas sp. CAU 1670]|uniref:threonine aldolase family protein n=1 Tax=Albimonas sp. CAU 1670 TaxID=3032599 RepID=UPI0023DBB042|nr:beta-eliminating lyase-related protein [Albimonas sp. CAU 1670]MDF2233831.1 beta-eliminating lyase-related protein [Albimonas sp. CAU 1670]
MMFASDNAGPAAPELMQAVVAANEGGAMPYGNDPLTASVTERIREIFEAPKAQAYLVATGTAANALALGTLVQPWQTVYCHRRAHIEEDECGAPEFYSGGAKLTLLEGDHAKIDAGELARALDAGAQASVHNVQPGAVSITQATELGAVYTPAEVRALADLAHARSLPVHMDGTRFSNAVARLGCSPAELSWKAGVDVLCLGASKCGAMAAEAVIFFDPDAARTWEFQLRRKRGGHLFSKMRYVSAQMDRWLTDGLWLDLAGRANAAADRMAAGLAEGNLATLLHPVDANALFVELPRSAHQRLHAAGAKYYLWPFDQPLEGPGDEMLSCRLVCNWATTEAEVDAFLAAARG